MICACIKNNICVQTAMFQDMDTAKQMLIGDYDLLLACPENRGVGHRYVDGSWYNPQPEKNADGTYYYMQDMDVFSGDHVLDPDEMIYEAIDNIVYQQSPPSELPLLYVKIVVPPVEDGEVVK